MVENPTHCEWCHLWASGPRCYKKTGYPKYEEQASKKNSSLILVLALASRFLPCFSCCSDFLQWWAVIRKCKPNKICLLQPTFCKLHHSNRNPNRTPLTHMDRHSSQWESKKKKKKIFYQNISLEYKCVNCSKIHCYPVCSLAGGNVDIMGGKLT